MRTTFTVCLVVAVVCIDSMTSKVNARVIQKNYRLDRFQTEVLQVFVIDNAAKFGKSEGMNIYLYFINVNYF